MTKQHANINRLAGRINKCLPMQKHLIVHKDKKKYTVKTVGGKTFVDGFEYKETDLIMRGALEAAHLIKNK